MKADGLPEFLSDLSLEGINRPQNPNRPLCHSRESGTAFAGITSQDRKRLLPRLVKLTDGEIYSQAHPQFCAKAWARRGGRFLRTPRRWFLPRAGGLQPMFLGSPSIPPSFAERHWMAPGESFPAGIPHPSLSPPGNPSGGKLGVGKDLLPGPPSLFRKQLDSLQKPRIKKSIEVCRIYLTYIHII